MTGPGSPASVVLAHDFLTQRGGAERVFLAMARAFPESPILTTLYEPAATFPEFAEHEVRTSPLQRARLLRRHFRAGLPLYPWAVRSLGPVDAGVLVSSSTSFAHGLRSQGCHLGYLYSPPHWLWDTARYNGARRGAALARPLLGRLRRLDRDAGQEPHLMVTCSAHAAAKIHDVYGRWAEVLAPPVRRRAAAAEPGDFFLVVSRLLPYKRVDAAVVAAGLLGARLVVVGSGPEAGRLRALAGAGVEFREQVSDAELDDLYARCLAVVMPGEEDLGLVPLEANAAGRPAVCLARGGALETVVPGRTGLLVGDPSAGLLAEAMAAAAGRRWDAAALQHHAAGWSEAEFARRLRLLVERFPRWCRRCGGDGLGPGPLAAILARVDDRPVAGPGVAEEAGVVEGGRLDRPLARRGVGGDRRP